MEHGTGDLSGLLAGIRAYISEHYEERQASVGSARALTGQGPRGWTRRSPLDGPKMARPGKNAIKERRAARDDGVLCCAMVEEGEQPHPSQAEPVPPSPTSGEGFWEGASIRPRLRVHGCLTVPADDLDEDLDAPENSIHRSVVPARDMAYAAMAKEDILNGDWSRALQGVADYGVTARRAEEIEALLAQSSEHTFVEAVTAWMLEKDMKAPDVYRRAGIDKKLFSKIMTKRDYQPSKDSAIQMAIGLELSLADTMDLLGRAGFAFSPSIKRDLMVEYCLREGIHDIYLYNDLLDELGMKTFSVA